MARPISLSNGATFCRAEERVREYCEVEVYRDIGYRGGYDDRTNATDVVTAEDLEAANNFYAQLSVLDRSRLLHNPAIPSCLAPVEDNDLGELTDERWVSVKPAIGSLVGAFLSIPNMTLSKTMRVVHLKKPHLLPVLDSLVVKFITGNDIEVNRFSQSELLQIALSALDIARADIVNNSLAFAELAEVLSDLPTPLPTVRLYDILCWSEQKWVRDGNTSGKYGTASRSLDQTVAVARPSEPSLPQPPPASGGRNKPRPPGEITTIREYRQIVGRAEGVIVVTGTKPPRAHSPLCSLLTDDRFKENVVLTEHQSTRYYWRASLLEARREFGAEPCRKCRPPEAFAHPQ